VQFSIKNNETLVFARRHLTLEKLLYILIDSIENSSRYAFDKKYKLYIIRKLDRCCLCKHIIKTSTFSQRKFWNTLKFSLSEIKSKEIYDDNDNFSTVSNFAENPSHFTTISQSLESLCQMHLKQGIYIINASASS